MVRVAVIGCGGLGVNIAGELAMHGHEVRMYDVVSEALDRVHPRLVEDRKALRECGLLRQPGFVGSVFCMSRLEDAVRVSTTCRSSLLLALVMPSWQAKRGPYSHHGDKHLLFPVTSSLLQQVAELYGRGHPRCPRIPALFALQRKEWRYSKILLYVQ